MFRSFLLNPKIYTKNQRRDKLISLSNDNLIFKNNFTGFNYSLINKKELFNDNNKYFYSYLENIILPVYEVLPSNLLTKFYLDCELDGLTEEEFNKKDNLFIEFNKYLLKYLDNKFPDKKKKILYADSSRLKNNGYKLSIHVVVNELGYFERKYLKKNVLEFINTLPKNIFYKDGKSFVDKEVYHSSQLIRIFYSSNNSPDSLLKPFIIENNKIITKNMNYVSNHFNDTLCGKYNETKDNIFIEDTEIKDTEIKKEKKNEPFSENNIIIPKWKINWVLNNIHVKNIYDIYSINNNNIFLKRIQKNVFCKLCNRNHENDNAFVKIKKNNIIFYCNRKTDGGVSIGSWYEKDKNDVITNTEIYDLKKENTKLKNKIYILENKLNTFNYFNKIEISKHTKKEYLKKNDNIFNKYYECALHIINDDLEEFKNSVKIKFKCVNLSLIKNRCLRIYDLITYKKENNLGDINCSIRNIFNIPNWKFIENLKNNIYYKGL